MGEDSRFNLFNVPKFRFAPSGCFYAVVLGIEASLIEFNIVYTRGCSKISSAEGLYSGFCSIIIDISYSN
jgi:hypothetical protein